MLPPRRRAVVVMHELEGLPISMIASQLGISTITVRWHLSAGRRDLTRILTSSHGDRQ
jgi:DNA-directed RNA polymerase specialized sigma24 family protein